MTIQPFSTVVEPNLIGAIHLSDDETIDTTLLNVAKELASAGCGLCGFVQYTWSMTANCHPDMFLKSMRGGQTVKISQSLGPAANGCRVDSSALAAAYSKIDQELDDGADLLILNRFGRCEAEGAGLRGLIEKAVDKSIPVLIAVRPKYVDQWNEFAGGYTQPIGSNHRAIIEWCLQSLCSPSEIHLAEVALSE